MPVEGLQDSSARLNADSQLKPFIGTVQSSRSTNSSRSRWGDASLRVTRNGHRRLGPVVAVCFGHLIFKDHETSPGREKYCLETTCGRRTSCHGIFGLLRVHSLGISVVRCLEQHYREWTRKCLSQEWEEVNGREMRCRSKWQSHWDKCRESQTPAQLRLSRSWSREAYDTSIFV